MTKVLFINGSPERQGNTTGLAAALLKGTEAETLNLTDYRINVYGQTLPGDQFDEVLAMMKKADVLIIGSPVYWHNICGSVRNLLDRFYGHNAAARHIQHHTAGEDMPFLAKLRQI